MVDLDTALDEQLLNVAVGQVEPQIPALQFALVGIDLLAWTRTLLLDGEHTLAEPKKLHYQLLHVAARIVRSARGTVLRIAQRWPWAPDLVAAFARLDALPRPHRLTNSTSTVYKGYGGAGQQPEHTRA